MGHKSNISSGLRLRSKEVCVPTELLWVSAEINIYSEYISWSYTLELVLFWAGGMMYEVLIVSYSYVHTSLVLLSNVYVCPAEYIIILIGSGGGGMLTLGGKLLILMSTLFS